jgi:hypothetical protein
MKLPWFLCFVLLTATCPAVEDLHSILEGVAGTRVLDSTVPANLDDKFHLGSDTKSFTALLWGNAHEPGKAVQGPHPRGSLSIRTT